MPGLVHEPNFARPVAPHRGRIYLGVALLTGAVFLAMTIGVQFGFIAPTFTADVIANMLFGIPVILVPLIIYVVITLIFTRILYIGLPTGYWPMFYDIGNWAVILLRG